MYLKIATFLRRVNAPHIIKYLPYLLVKNKTVRTSSKLKISDVKINLSIGEFIDYWVYVDGTLDYNWMKILENNLNGVFFDVGANIGIYSFSLYRKASEVIAFEPEKTNCNRIKSTIKSNRIKNIKLVKKAVSSTTANNKRLYVHNNQHGFHSLLKREELSDYETIKTITLDDYSMVHKIKNVSIIKIDVEGAELDVLVGAQNLIKNQKPLVLVEINAPLLKIYKRNPKEIFNFFKKQNYKAFLLRGKKLERITKYNNVYNENILFVHKNAKIKKYF